VSSGNGPAPGVSERLRAALADRYPIERAVGRGGMATVYLARDPKHHRNVAVKVLHPELAAGLGTERFLREIRIEAGLQHPHILPLHDSGEVDGFLYYVMPYIDGESLRQRLTRETRLPLTDALAIAADVADALGYAHQLGVIHRDIKPENVLLSNGHALVADFGIAKAVELAGDSKLTETGWGMGTPAYMCPEQIVGEPADGRSDLYGLGCVVYEMLAGRPPFTATTARGMFTHHQLDTPAPLRTMRPDVPAGVEMAVATALAKLPDDRFRSVSEFLDSLTGSATRKSAARPVSKALTWTRRQVRAGLVVSAASLLLSGLYFGVLRGRPVAFVANRLATLAVVPILDLQGDTSRAYISEGLTDELSTDLGQIRGLQVINRQTMLAYSKTRKTPRQIAQELKADMVVTGTLQRFGDTVHLTTEVTPRASDRALWARSYGGSEGDLLRVQRETAWALGARLRGERPRSSAAGAAAGDPEAIDAYIRGRYWWNRRGQANLLRSIQLFGQALDADPSFAPAYAGMADAYTQLGYGSWLAPDDAFPKAAASARRALELDSTLAEPHAALGYYNMYYAWDWAAAEREFQLAIARNPSYATAHEWHGLFLAAMGHFDEALAEERRAQALDPLSNAITGTTGWVLHYSGKQDEAERVLRTAVRVDPTFGVGHLYLGRVLQAKGELDSAINQFEPQLTGPLAQWAPTLSGLGNLYAIQGRRADALRMLRRMDSLSQSRYITSFAVAVVHAGLHQPDSTFAWLERAVKERTHWLVWLNRDPRWRSLRGDPRFADLVHRIGLPP
jgi:eukaryotic-like serine/threonine-protein kinase